MGWRWKTQPTILVGLSTALVAACGTQVGGQTGGEDSQPDPPPPVIERHVQIPGEPEQPLCPHEAPVILSSLDDAPSGLSAGDVLAYAEVQGPLSLVWHLESPFGSERTIEPMPPLDGEALTLAIEYSGGEIRYFGPSDCARVDIQVNVLMRSESGSLDEQTSGVLYAVQPAIETKGVRLELLLHPSTVQVDVPTGILEGRPAPQVALLSGDLDVKATIMSSPASSEEGRLAAVPILVWFDQDGPHGNIDAWLFGSDTGQLVLSHQLATFGRQD